MGKVTNMEGVILTPLKVIEHPQGDLFHAMRKSDPGFSDFGEVYFSTINQNEIKGWKKHVTMTLNLVVPVGEIKFMLYDNRNKVFNEGEYFSVALSKKNYQRLTIPPGIWVAFEGKGEDLNLLLNIADIEHDPSEIERIEIERIRLPYE